MIGLAAPSDLFSGVTELVIQNRPAAAVFRQTRYSREIGDGLRRCQFGFFKRAEWSPEIRHTFYLHLGQVAPALALVRSHLKDKCLAAASELYLFDLETGIWLTPD